MTTNEERQAIRQVAAQRQQTALWLCQSRRAQHARLRHTLQELAERRQRLRESFTQWRKTREAWHHALGQPQVSETAALTKLLAQLTISSTSSPPTR